MAQTTKGAKKVAAKRAGVSLEEYEAKIAAGLKRCTKCKAWKPAAGFSNDKSRHDGVSAKCRSCSSRNAFPDHMTLSERIKASWVARKRFFVPPMKGKKMSPDSRNKMRESAKNRPSNRIGKKHTLETRAKIAIVTRERTQRGENHYAYTHGKHQRDKSDRRTVEYKNWRDAVYARDKYTCQVCGDSKGGNLQAHHIKSFAAHPDLRYVVDNGTTLCRDCHERLHLKPIPIFKCRRKKHPHPPA